MYVQSVIFDRNTYVYIFLQGSFIYTRKEMSFLSPECLLRRRGWKSFPGETTSVRTLKGWFFFIHWTLTKLQDPREPSSVRDDRSFSPLFIGDHKLSIFKSSTGFSRSMIPLFYINSINKKFTYWDNRRCFEVTGSFYFPSLETMVSSISLLSRSTTLFHFLS